MPQTRKKMGPREARLQKWGNSKAVRLTQDVLEAAGVDTTDDVVLEVEVEPNRITLVQKDKMTPFQKLFAGYDEEKPDPEPLWDEAEPAGREDW